MKSGQNVAYYTVYTCAPSIIDWEANMMAFIPEAQTLLIVVAGVCSGSPCKHHHKIFEGTYLHKVLLGLQALAQFLQKQHFPLELPAPVPAWDLKQRWGRAQSNISNILARFTASLIAVPPSRGATTEASFDWKLAIGVRAKLTITGWRSLSTANFRTVCAACNWRLRT